MEVRWYHISGHILLGYSLTEALYNVNPGLINHGLLIRGYSSNSHNPILKWYPPNQPA